MNKGITLVALIITIIMLLILAVVAISAVSGNGIIAHAKNAKKDYLKAQENELVNINMLDKAITEKSFETEKYVDMNKYLGHSITINGINLLVMSVDTDDQTIATVTTIESIGRSKVNTQGDYGYTKDTASFLYKNSTYESFINSWVEKSALKDYMIKTNIDIKNYEVFGNITNVETYAYPQTKESINNLFPSYNWVSGPYDSVDTSANMYILNGEINLCSGDDVYEAEIGAFCTNTSSKEKGCCTEYSTHVFGSVIESHTHPVFRIKNLLDKEIKDNGTYNKTSPYSPQ